jgi:predicted permease
MSAIALRLDEQAPAGEPRVGISVTPYEWQVAGPGARLALWLLMGAVGCVVAVAAANVSGLAVARGVARQREMAIRAALGAGRGRLARQLVVESLTLAALSAALGLAVAAVLIGAIPTIAPEGLAPVKEVKLDWRVLGYALAVCGAAGAAAGLAPAVTMAWKGRHALEGGRSVAGGVNARAIRRMLVVGELAVAIVLLAGAGLLVRSFQSVQGVDSGFTADGVVAIAVAAPPGMEVKARAGFHTRVLEEVRSLPGVEVASLASEIFIGGTPEQSITVEGGGVERVRMRSDEVSAGFFRTLGVALIEGRDFTDGDGREAPRVAVVNRTMARWLWPGGRAAGRRFKLGPPDSTAPWYTVVGVAGDMRRQGPETAPVAQMFEPLGQNPPRAGVLLVKTRLEDPLRLGAAVRAAVQRVEKRAPVYGVSLLEERMRGHLAQRRFQTMLVLVFSALAMLMAAVGIYGLIRYSVASRTREIGVRVALGARASDVVRLVLTEGLQLMAAGLGLGLIGALALGRAGSSLLFGVTAWDPVTYVAVALLVVVVALGACWLPARSAARVAPSAALREG